MEDITFGVYLNHLDAKMPSKANPTDAGWDLSSVEEVSINPGERKLVDTGVVVDMTTSNDIWEAQIRPRSGNALKLGLTIVNTPGTIDYTYHNNIKVILLNTSKEVVNLPKGSKIAQMIFKRVPQVTLKQLDAMPTNDSRGTKGFGSSGQ
jgi:dUTP pyrophosphatase